MSIGLVISCLFERGTFVSVLSLTFVIKHIVETLVTLKLVHNQMKYIKSLLRIAV